MLAPDSMRRWACAASASANVLSITGRITPFGQGWQPLLRKPLDHGLLDLGRAGLHHGAKDLQVAVQHHIHGQLRTLRPTQQPHRHQAPPVGQRPHVALQVRSPDEVDHHIHAPALRGLRHHRLKVFAAVVGGHIGPAAQHGATLVAPGRGEHAPSRTPRPRRQRPPGPCPQAPAWPCGGQCATARRRRRHPRCPSRGRPRQSPAPRAPWRPRCPQSPAPWCRHRQSRHGRKPPCDATGRPG